MDGDIFQVTGHYLKSDLGTPPKGAGTTRDRAGRRRRRLKSVRVLCDGRVSDVVDVRRP